MRFLSVLLCWLGLGGAALADELQHGDYLAKLANCAGCHTARGGAPLAGGRLLETEFGRFVTPNISPDPGTGIGAWDVDAFRAVLQRGERPDGSALYPACPVSSYQKLQPADIDAIYAWIFAQPAQAQVNAPHELGWPWSWRSLLPLWQWMNLTAEPWSKDPGRSDAWNRGAYLVQALGHCDSCHAERNWWGGFSGAEDDPGGQITGWRAPSLFAPSGAGVQQWLRADLIEWLRSGRNHQAVALGPMAGVLRQSLQYLSEADAAAMAEYLQSLAPQEQPGLPLLGLSGRDLQVQLKLGGHVYQQHCADCHGEQGEGSLAAVPLAGNRAVAQPDPRNLVQVLMQGAYAPGTAANPQPFGMPPFRHQLDDAQAAAVLSYIRWRWGDGASMLAPVVMQQLYDAELLERRLTQ